MEIFQRAHKPSGKIDDQECLRFTARSDGIKAAMDRTASVPPVSLLPAISDGLDDEPKSFQDVAKANFQKLWL